MLTEFAKLPTFFVGARQVANLAKRSIVDVGLPRDRGYRPRLILAHVNAEPLRQDSPVIEVQSVLSAFVKRIRLRRRAENPFFFKGQLTRLAAANIRLALFHSDGEAEQIETKVLARFDL